MFKTLNHSWERQSAWNGSAHETSETSSSEVARTCAKHKAKMALAATNESLQFNFKRRFIDDEWKVSGALSAENKPVENKWEG